MTTPKIDMSKAVVTDDLRTRCAEILEWKKTGILTGGALRSCARKLNERLGLSSDMGQALAMAESETAREAMEAVLSHGAEAVEPEQKPVAWIDQQELRYLQMVSSNDGWRNHKRTIVVGGEKDGRLPLFASPVRSAQETVKVKPLEWTETSDDRGRYATTNTRIGGYDVFELHLTIRGEQRIMFGWSGHWINADQKAESFEAAKAAAQADYEARISAALFPPGGETATPDNGGDIAVLKADRENLHSRVRELRLIIQTLMAKLADLLDEDHFADCEDIVRKAGILPPGGETATPETPPPVPLVAFPDTFDRLKAIIVECVGVNDWTSITPEADLVDDVGLDSLDTVEIVMAAEEHFGVEIDDADVALVVTMQDAVNAVDKARAALATTGGLAE